MMVLLCLNNHTGRHKLAPKTRAESTIQTDDFHILQCKRKLSTSLIRLEQMVGLFLGYYNISANGPRHALVCSSHSITIIIIIINITI